MKIKSQISGIICSFFLTMMAVNLSAQNFGYVDTQAIVQEMPEVKEANANIETFRNQLLKKGKDKLEALQTKYVELEKKQGRGEISPLQLEEEGAKLETEKQALIRFEQESQQSILSKSEKLLKPLRDRIQNAIDQVASENGYTYIFDYSTGFVLYADSAADVGNKVRSKLGM